MSVKPNLTVLREACHKLAMGFNDFWILAALTDQSYEDGVKKRGFSKAVDAYAEAGVDHSTFKQLQNGVNGNLLDVLRQDHEFRDVIRRPGKGQDITFINETSCRTARVEVKLLFDCTFTKHYPTTAADWEKLARVRAEPTGDDLFLVVFFNQMPHYDYPKRSAYLRKCGIDSQFTELKRHLPQMPAWPTDGPFRHPLEAPPVHVGKILLERWPPRPEWKLDLANCFRDAMVGVAIWEIP